MTRRFWLETLIGFAVITVVLLAVGLAADAWFTEAFEKVMSP